MPFPTFNAPSAPTSFVAAVDVAKGHAVASVIIAGNNVSVQGPLQLRKPYINLQVADNANVALLSSSFLSSYQQFGPIRNVGFTWRPFAILAGPTAEDYPQPPPFTNGIGKVIVYNPRTGSRADIEASQVPWSYVGGAGADAGLYAPASVIVQGIQPFFGSTQDTFDICFVWPNTAQGATGVLQLDFYNFDVRNFNKTAMSGWNRITA